MAGLRVGVVGLGGNGRAFVRGYLASKRAELVAVCDLDPERVQMVRDEHGVEVGYNDLDEMLTREHLDVLSVHTPDHMHADPFIAGLEAGCHVFVEKPMGNTMEDLERMTAAARASDHKTLVGHILRFNPFFAEVKELCAAGELGEVFYLEADYIHRLVRQGIAERTNPYLGNINWWLDHEKPIVGGGGHQLDLLRWYADSNVVAAFGLGNSIAFPAMKHDDCMVGVFKMESGAVAKVTGAYGVVGPRPQHCNLAVYGTEGTIRGGQLIKGEHDEPEITDLATKQISGHPFEPEIEHFLECIIEDEPTLTDAFDGANSAAATIMAAESILSGRPEPVPVFLP